MRTSPAGAQTGRAAAPRESRVIDVRVRAVDPPFASHHTVSFGLQVGRDVVEPVPAISTTTFDATFDVVHDAGAPPDFRGHHVHGRKGDRFLYLSWGVPDGTEPFVMFARAKIELAGIPTDVLDDVIEHGGVLVAELRATNQRGQPATGSVRPVDWSVER